MPKYPEVPGDGFRLFRDETGQYRHRSMWLRRWREGDGPVCAVTRKAESVPCGEPVAVVLVQFTSHRLGRVGSSIGGRCRAVCALHLPFAAGAARLSDEAHAAAHDLLVQAHPDEWARYLDHEVTQRRTTATEQAMRELASFLKDDTEGTR